ncbi:MAG: response regulator transcription factor [Saprospiraceae bacterium]|nr:response regulator transcription factor [Saprospiraceae bacterium]
MIKYQVLVYEDNDDLRTYIKSILDTKKEIYEVIGDFPDCSNILEEVKRLKPNIVLLDIRMPNVNGLEGLNIIKKNFESVKVLMLTDFNDDKYILKAIQLGCDGYMLKGELPFGLEKALKIITDGEGHLTPSVAKKAMQLLSKPDFKTAEYSLTSKQQEVLNLLAKAYSYKEIATQLKVSVDTIGTHIKQIYDKLQVNSKAGAVRKAFEEGLVKLD